MTLDLERLREELPSKRWFSDKGRTIASVDLVDRGTLEGGDEALVLTLVRVSFTEGPAALYHLPLLVTEEGSFRDATESPDRLRVLGELMAGGHPIKGEGGIFHFSGPGLNPEEPPGTGSVWVISTEQSNTSVVFDDEIIVKFFRKVEPGPNPDLELTRLLTNEGFRGIPAQVGEIFYEETPEEDSPVADDERPATIDLGIAQHFVTGGTEGWELVLDHIGRTLDEIHEADVAEDMVSLIEERSSDLLGTIEQLGEVTAAMHVELAREDFEPEFRPEAIEADDLRAWNAGTLERLNVLAAEIAELAPLRDEIAARIGSVVELTDAGSTTRIHGDYHLGQVLRVPRSWFILDFEGEPARSLEERRAKHSPLKDVAGMLRSLSYAAQAVLFRRAEPDDPEWKRLEPWTATWEALARDRFLTAYLAKSHEGRFLPQDQDALATLLAFFEVDKVLYEISYEKASRPDWVRIPLRGIRTLIERGR